MASLFTTKNGDRGTTRLLSGEKVPKTHPAVVCSGVLDTFRAGLAEGRLMLMSAAPEDAARHGEFLLWLLHICFIIGTQVNDPACRKPQYRIATIGTDHLKRLEKEQAQIESGLKLPRSFIVTATCLPAARFDVLATQARDLEREIVALAQVTPGFEATDLLAFTNRLSDYLVALARDLEHGEHQPVDYSLVTG